AGTIIARKYIDDFDIEQPTRRNFMEAVHTNFLLQVPPGAMISRSSKLEHGKTRALYACDTVNYFHFDAPCTAVEKILRNDRTILQPSGASDYCDFRTRGKKLRHYKIILDFEDFNSAHTLTAQKLVVEELFHGLQSDWHDWLVNSFDNMRVRAVDGTLRHVKGTLMSGHRMTSIINTILNTAYIRLALGEDIYLRIHSEHVGDDIIISTDDAGDADTIVERCLASGLRFQRGKQGFGTLCAEFLRVSFNECAGVGYLPRAIASAVSGSWVREYVLKPDEYCSSIMRVIWNMTSRSGGRVDSARLLCTTLVRRLGIARNIALAVCDNQASYSGGPIRHRRDVRHNGGSSITRQPIELTCSEMKHHIRKGGVHNATDVRHKWREKVKALPKHAITSYIESSEDIHALRRIGIDLQVCINRMLEASFYNLVTVVASATSTYKWSAAPINICNTRVITQRSGSWLRKKQRPIGMLCSLIIPSLDARAINALGLVLQRDMSDFRMVASKSAIRVDSAMTFSDGSSLAKVGYGQCDARTDYSLYV
ncbi:MAG: hypothetical protein GY789_27730, partial [Hyphomicrobiales bacterium]|nr:hypothetical protein [Hyphomicrobiales bacterium]